MRHYSAYENSKKKSFNQNSSNGGGGFQSTGMYDDDDDDEEEEDDNNEFNEYNEDASRGLGNSSDIMSRWEKELRKMNMEHVGVVRQKKNLKFYGHVSCFFICSELPLH